MNEEMFTNAISVFNLDKTFVNTYSDINEAVKDLRLKSKYNISSCICGIRNNAHGYIWKRIKVPFISLENEIWKDVVGFEGLYKVSNLGRVISIQFHGDNTCNLLSQNSINGYLVVKLRDWKNNIVKTARVHRLVAEAFIPNPENKTCIDHIDTNIKNNNVSNLRWVTPMENQHNPITLSRLRNSIIKYNKSEENRIHTSELNSIPIIQYDLNYNYIRDFKSQTEASKILNIDNSEISKVCRGLRKSAHGFIFRFKNREQCKEN